MENVFDQFPKALELHPAILQLGLRIAAGEIAGGNARCLGMLTAFKQFIQVERLPVQILSSDVGTLLHTFHHSS